MPIDSALQATRRSFYQIWIPEFKEKLSNNAFFTKNLRETKLFISIFHIVR